MGDLKGHRDLDVWNLSIDFSADIYRMSEKFPKHEMYGLTSQLRRAVVSIAANIAEGAARQTKKEFIQFLYCSLGSSSEVETLLILVEKLGYSEEKNLFPLFTKRERISSMLYGLIKKLKV